MRTKFLLAFMLLAIAAFGQQNPIQIDANGLTQTFGAGGIVTRGQIVKINSSGQVVPMATTDTSGAIGIAATSQQNVGQVVAVSIGGSPLVQVDGSCAPGNLVGISNTTGGSGHCGTAVTGQIGVALTAANNGFAQVQLTGAGGGGISSIGAATNVKTLGAFGDTKYAQNVTLSRVFSTVTLPTGSTATVGQLIQCGSPTVAVEVVPFPSTNGGQTLPAKITAVNGQVVTYNTLPVGSGTDLTDGQCFWGHDDSVPLTTAFNNCKTSSKPIVFNGPIQNYPCNVYLPAGGYMITSTPFYDNGAGGNTMGVGILGDGMNTSVIYPMLGFTNTAQAGCGFVLCGFGWGQTYKAFGIELFASGFAPGGIAPSAMNVAALECGNCFMEDVRIADWFNGGFNTIFMLEDSSGAQINHVRIENTQGGATSGGGYECNICGTSMYHSFLSNTTQNMSIKGTGGRGSGSFFNDHGSLIDEGSITTIANAKGVSFFGTQLMGGANCISVDATSEVRSSGGYCGTFNGGVGGGGPTVASGGKFWAADLEVSANGAGQYCYNSAAYGGIIDLGGNQCILAGGATTYKSGSFVNQFALTHLPINGFQSGTLTAGTVQSVSIDQPLSVLSLTWTPSNAFACTAGSFPTFSVSDGTITLTTAATDTATNGAVTHTFSQTAANLLNPSGASGTVLQIKVVTTGTCGTAPTNTNINIWGQASAPSF